MRMEGCEDIPAPGWSERRSSAAQASRSLIDLAPRPARAFRLTEP
jgi:hypothetical protein